MNKKALVLALILLAIPILTFMPVQAKQKIKEDVSFNAYVWGVLTEPPIVDGHFTYTRKIIGGLAVINYPTGVIGAPVFSIPNPGFGLAPPFLSWRNDQITRSFTAGNGETISHITEKYSTYCFENGDILFEIMIKDFKAPKDHDPATDGIWMEAGLFKGFQGKSFKL